MCCRTNFGTCWFRIWCYRHHKCAYGCKFFLQRNDFFLNLWTTGLVDELSGLPTPNLIPTGRSRGHNDVSLQWFSDLGPGLDLSNFPADVRKLHVEIVYKPGDTGFLVFLLKSTYLKWRRSPWLFFHYQIVNTSSLGPKPAWWSSLLPGFYLPTRNCTCKRKIHSKSSLSLYLGR